MYTMILAVMVVIIVNVVSDAYEFHHRSRLWDRYTNLYTETLNATTLKELEGLLPLILTLCKDSKDDRRLHRKAVQLRELCKDRIRKGGRHIPVATEL